MGSKPRDLTGKVFGRLTVVSKAEDTYTPSGRKKINWNCICECGNTCVARSSNLLCGDKRSCGCLHSELLVKRNKKKHGDSQNNRLYKIWSGMKSRCNYIGHQEYYRYGGRGISVCDEWDSYENFKQWALSSGYSDSLSIDRIDNDLGYFPENCRWANDIEQSNNRSTNVFITYNNETKTVAEWAREIGMKRDTLAKRIKCGWNIEDAFFKPVEIRGDSRNNGNKI